LQTAHTTHKLWDQTETDSKRFSSLFDDAAFRTVFRRVFEEGNYAKALKHKASNDRPYVVLITGVNGIRKTTTIHQPKFGQVLAEALNVPKDSLPTGKNSFFRQLDHIIASLTNVQFEKLYRDNSSSVEQYIAAKADIFKNYRKVSERSD